MRSFLPFLLLGALASCAGGADASGGEEVPQEALRSPDSLRVFDSTRMPDSFPDLLQEGEPDSV